MYDKRVVQVLEKKGGRGDVCFHIYIPKNMHHNLGAPENYSIILLPHMLLLKPVRRIEVKVDGREELKNLEHCLENILYDETVAKKTILCADIVKYIDVSAYAHYGIKSITVFCRGNKYEYSSLVKYNDGTVEVIKQGLCCGSGNPSSTALVQLVAELSQRDRTSEEVRKVAQIIGDSKLRGKAVRIEINNLENKLLLQIIG